MNQKGHDKKAVLRRPEVMVFQSAVGDVRLVIPKDSVNDEGQLTGNSANGGGMMFAFSAFLLVKGR